MQGVDISFTVCLFACNLVILYGYGFLRRILHGGSSASWAGNFPFWGTLLQILQIIQKPKIGRIASGVRTGHA